MNAILAAAAVLGVVTAGSGWFIWASARSRASGAALFLGGAVLLIGCASSMLHLSSVTPTAFRLAGALMLPVAVMVYPRPSWRDPLLFVLLTLVGAAGTLSVVWPDSIEPMGYVIVCALLVAAWWRFERGDAEVRRALTWSSLAWIGAGLVTLFLVFVSESAGAGTTGLTPDLVGTALAVVGPAAMVIGVVRPELVDVRGLVTRSVVATTVLITYIAAAVGVVSTIGAIRGRPFEVTPTIVMCAALAFGVRPLQVMLRGVVDQLLFGDRPDPLAAATSLADRIGDNPVLALDAIRESLVLPYASLRAGGDLLADSGTEVTHTRVLPLRLGEDVVGEIVVGLRAGDLRLSPADEDVLRIVAPLLAQTLRARAMTRDLQRSREAVVTAVEEERRRLRRDLHDGLGPTLSGVAFATDAARNQLRSNPDKADELLVVLRAETAGAITEIRRLVEGLRPPALDELGLVAAVQQHASNLHSASGSPLTVSVEVQAALPPLTAATEVAAYRIIVEALTNVVRHAEATRAVVELAVADDALALSVRDDGRTRGDWTPGVGIASMRERSQQVGGTLTATALADGGLVRARIPLLCVD